MASASRAPFSFASILAKRLPIDEPSCAGLLLRLLLRDLRRSPAQGGGPRGRRGPASSSISSAFARRCMSPGRSKGLPAPPKLALCLAWACWKLCTCRVMKAEKLRMTSRCSTKVMTIFVASSIGTSRKRFTALSSRPSVSTISKNCPSRSSSGSGCGGGRGPPPPPRPPDAPSERARAVTKAEGFLTLEPLNSRSFKISSAPSCGNS
mmetsp:Transcript_94082/g.186520  ORF Transcript_94082/g.186520 Transcript_94082/m.186520 type:complete len:208 (-) Transcript_94082:178-801(-)